MLVILAQNFLPYGTVLSPRPEDSKLGLEGGRLYTTRRDPPTTGQGNKSLSPSPLSMLLI